MNPSHKAGQVHQNFQLYKSIFNWADWVFKYCLWFLNPIAADTGLCLRPVQYERKAGLPLKIAEQQFFK